jgi:hypothetical protein
MVFSELDVESGVSLPAVVRIVVCVDHMAVFHGWRGKGAAGCCC